MRYMEGVAEYKAVECQYGAWRAERCHTIRKKDRVPLSQATMRLRRLRMLRTYIEQPETAVVLRAAMFGRFDWNSHPPLLPNGELAADEDPLLHQISKDLCETVRSYNGRILDSSWHAEFLILDLSEIIGYSHPITVAPSPSDENIPIVIPDGKVQSD